MCHSLKVARIMVSRLYMEFWNSQPFESNHFHESYADPYNVIAWIRHHHLIGTSSFQHETKHSTMLDLSQFMLCHAGSDMTSLPLKSIFAPRGFDSFPSRESKICRTHSLLCGHSRRSVNLHSTSWHFGPTMHSCGQSIFIARLDTWDPVDLRL